MDAKFLALCHCFQCQNKIAQAQTADPARLKGNATHEKTGIVGQERPKAKKKSDQLPEQRLIKL
jgi:hypothetical protein